ncbi:ATP-binding protein [Ferroacidibacillus organovorans]|uniref:ATP-binding protein n=1 Tax=Ferroacidibacillus organovorans TaxID=1765683 RepID=UPI001F1593BF|nr:ATP-binding protein [Ferroacidibacillus organovorans]
MGRNQIIEALHILQMPAMADAYERQEQGIEGDGLTFEERLGFLVDAEVLYRRIASRLACCKRQNCVCMLPRKISITAKPGDWIAV